MEQARYWMYTKRKHDGDIIKKNPSVGDSWEEQAFAEDAAGALTGSCVWPPRSYTCSFCRREFRSAQALGGHMNVHRRDRARLKQSPNPQTIEPPQICNFLCNSSSETGSAPIRVSKTHTSYNANTCLLPVVEEGKKNQVFQVPFSPWSNFAVDEYFQTSDLTHNINKKNEEKKMDSRVLQGPVVKTDLSVSLNLFICRNTPEEVASCKRRRIDENLLSFFPIKSQEVVIKPSSRDDLDLELRLGDPPPKVK